MSAADQARQIWQDAEKRRGIFAGHTCDRCGGDGEVEKPVPVNRLAAEATCIAPCPKCRPNAARDHLMASLDADRAHARDTRRAARKIA